MTVPSTELTITLRIPPDAKAAIEETAERTDRDVASVVGEMLDEAVKMRRFPGRIVFADEATGRRPWIAGTGLEVREVLDIYRRVGEDRDGLRKGLHWLSEQQLQAAFEYAEAYPEDVERWERVEAARMTVEELWEKYPATRPRRR